MLRLRLRPVHLLVPFLCAGMVVQTAAQKGASTLPRSTPEAQGISSSALLAFVEEAEKKIDALHSVMVVRHGQVVAEGWWKPYAADEPHMMFSLSKSFTSTAVGLAVADGKLSVDDQVLKFFPDEAPAEPSANLKAMRVRDLLTMTAGHHEEDIRNFPYDSDESVVEQFFARPVSHKPGTLFVYNTPASYMLSAIVQKVTGQTVLDYLRPRLFEPLGIANPTWDASKQGVSMGGFGLNMRTEDIARFGQLYLRKGMWQGKQLIPAAWIDAATGRQVSNGSSPASDWEQGYGYQFWRSRHGFYRGDGAHGQFCLVLPQHEAVVAITAGTRDLQGVVTHVWDSLVPALKPAALPANATAHRALTAKLASLTLQPQTSTATSPTAATRVGKRYVFETPSSATPATPGGANAPPLHSIIVDSLDAAGTLSIMMRVGDDDQRIAAAPGAWRTATVMLRGKPDAIAASGAWTADDTYTLKVVRYRTPFATTYKLRFAGDQLIVDRELNVGAADTRTMQFVGKTTAPTSAGGGGRIM